MKADECAARKRPLEIDGKIRNPGIAALLSALIPGLGQIYNGQKLWAIFWLILTPIVWIGSGGSLGWMCHLVSAYYSYIYAWQTPQR